MAESTLSLTRADIRNRLALYLDFGTPTADERTTIERLIKDGELAAYFPHDGEKSFSWSFLTVKSTLALSNGDQDYTLPDNFSGIMDRVTVVSGTTAYTLTEISDVDDAILRATESVTTGIPQSYYVRPTGIAGGASAGQRWEILFFPTPNASLTATYLYQAAPDSATSDNYMLGGPRFSMVVLQSCLAEAERYYKPEEQAERQKFAMMLKAAMMDDETRRRRTAASSNQTTPAFGTWSWLRREVAGAVLEKWNTNLLTFAESKLVDSFVEQGLNRVWSGSGDHIWSFLIVSTTLTLTPTSQEAYTLPAGFLGVVGTIAVTANGVNPTALRQVMPDEILQRRVITATSDGTPQVYAIRAVAASGTAVQRYEIMLYPEPTGTNIDLTYRYRVSPATPSTSAEFPSGNSLMSHIYRAACLAVAGKESGDLDGMIQTAIAADKKVIQAESKAWSSTEPAYGTWSWLKREVSGTLWDIWALAYLSHAQIKALESAVEQGLNRVWYGAGEHEWSFLSTKSISANNTLTSGAVSLDMVSGFLGIVGTVTIISGTGATKSVLRQVSVEELLARYAITPESDSTPQIYALRAKAGTGTARQLYEMLFYPSPSMANCVIEYRYRISPTTPTSSAEYPIGHAPMALVYKAAALNAAGKETPELERLMQEAVDADKKLIRVESKAWSSVEPVSGTFEWLKRELSGSLFDIWSLAYLSHAQTRLIENILNQGLQNVYYPPVADGGESHKWSFMTQQGIITLTNADYQYDLPSDFLWIEDEILTNTATEAIGSPIIQLTSPATVLSRRQSETSAARPNYAAVRAKAATGSAQQTYELIVHPTPGATATLGAGNVLSFRYAASPSAISTSSPYPLGTTPLLTQAFKMSCLAVADGYRAEPKGFQQQYQSALMAAIASDQKTKAKVENSAPVTTPAFGHLDWFRRRCGEAMSYGYNFNTWTHQQSEKVFEIISRAVRMVYAPPARQAGAESYTWSFLRPESSLSITSGDGDYDLPATEVGIVSQLEFSGSSQRAVARVTADELLQTRSNATASNGPPKIFAVRPKTSTGSARQVYEVLLYPLPDTSYTLKYHALLEPAELSSSTPYPLGGRFLAEPIMSAILYLIALEMGQGIGEAKDHWMTQMDSAIQQDRQNMAKDDQAASMTDPARGSRDWLLRMIGGDLYGWNSALWTSRELQHIESVLDSALTRVYNPPVRGDLIGNKSPDPAPVYVSSKSLMKGGIQRAHVWSFLKPRQSIAVTTALTDLPSGIGDIVGPVTFASGTGFGPLRQVRDSELRSMQAGSATTGRPRYYSVSPKTTDGTGIQLFQIGVHPTPDQSYTLAYQGKVTPAALTAAAPYPYGGVLLADTIIASAKAILAEGSPEFDQRNAIYIQRLSASISADIGVEEEEGESFNIAVPTYGSYIWLQQEIGRHAGFGSNYATWSHEHSSLVNSTIQRGLYRFYREAKWNFLYEPKTLILSAPYTTGTIAVSSGTVTLTSGTWPTWAADGMLYIGGVRYNVASRTSGTVIVLEETDVTVAAGTSYTITRRWYDYPTGADAIVGDFVFSESTWSRPIRVCDQQTLDEWRIRGGMTGVPVYAAVSAENAITGTVRRLEFVPAADAVYRLTYRTRRSAIEIGTGESPLGGKEHAETILWACLAALSGEHEDRYKANLAESIGLDSTTQGAETIDPDTLHGIDPFSHQFTPNGYTTFT